MLELSLRRILILTLSLFAVAYLASPIPVDAQLLKKSDFGAGLTVAFYQFDEARSKQIPEMMSLKQTSATADEEIDYISRTFGIEDMKVRHLRSIGLREGEGFTDVQVVNEKPFSFTIVPRIVTRDDVRVDLTVNFAGQTILSVKDVVVKNYETVALRGGRGEFGVREFIGPDGKESVPEKRALMVTMTAAITLARGLQNRPTDISRATDQFGSKVTLSDSDVFVMPAVVNRIPPKFVVGSSPKGSITLEGIVTPEGKITNVRVLDTPDSALNVKAIEAFRQYKFSPARLNGKATYATYRETILFSKPAPL
ncbi:MAG: energy transducer TonB [Acidobacteriota bacterium]